MFKFLEQVSEMFLNSSELSNMEKSYIKDNYGTKIKELFFKFELMSNVDNLRAAIYKSETTIHMAQRNVVKLIETGEKIDVG